MNFVIQDMLKFNPREFHWKVHIELAQVYDRIGEDQQANEHLEKAILDCPESSKWKLWLIASRIMQNQGYMDEARMCVERGCIEAPVKQQSVALLEYSKYFEMIKDDQRAVQIVKSVTELCKGEWKVQFEAVMTLVRCGDFDRAEKLCEESLKTHFATGRLWAVMVQIQHSKCKTQKDFDRVQ